MKVLSTLTLHQFRDKLVEHGLSIGYNKMLEAIEHTNLFPFVHKIPMKQNEYIILEKDFEEWAMQHSVEREVQI